MTWLRLGYLGALGGLLLSCSDDASLGRGSSQNNFEAGGASSSGSGNHSGSGGAAGSAAAAARGGADSAGRDAASGAATQAGEPSSGGEPGLDDGSVNLSQVLTDAQTPGTSACENETLADVLAAISRQWPELADITRLYAPGTLGDGSLIYAFAEADGFRVVIKRGSGDCPAGCIDNEYWYFDTTAGCQVIKRGHYAHTFDGGANCYRITGEPLWGLPEPTSAGACPTVDVTALNSACVNGACPSGLTPVKFYGVAGTSGPQFCTCSIPCAESAAICPTGTSCVTIADGPGQVCSAP